MSTDTDATEAGPTGDDPGQHRRITMDPAAVDAAGVTLMSSATRKLNRWSYMRGDHTFSRTHRMTNRFRERPHPGVPVVIA